MLMLAALSLELPLLGLLLLCSGFFSGSETAFFSLTSSEMAELSGSRSLLDRWMAELIKRPKRLINTILLGNMVVNIIFSSVAAVMVLELKSSGASPWMVGLASILPLLAVLLIGEVTPKLLAYGMAKKWALIASAPLMVLQWVARPILAVLEIVFINPILTILMPRDTGPKPITSQELSAMLELSAHQEDMDQDVGSLLREIIELTDLRARDVMTPRVEMVAFDLDDGPEALRTLFIKTHLRRMPVYRESSDNILGVIHAKRALMSPEAPVESLIRKPVFVPEMADLEKVLHQFRQSGRQMAIVVDEYGGTAGLITLEDVVEALVGDIEEPGSLESPPPVQEIKKGRYLVSADLLIRDWAEAFNIDEPAVERVRSLGGFVASLLGHLPEVGDTVDWRNLSFTVHAMRGRRIRSLELRLKEGDV